MKEIPINGNRVILIPDSVLSGLGGLAFLDELMTTLAESDKPVVMTGPKELLDQIRVL